MNRLAEGLRHEYQSILTSAINYLPAIGKVILILFVAVVLIRVATALLRRSLALGKLDETMVGLATSAARFLLWVMVIAAVMKTLGFNEVSVAVAGTTALIAMALASGASGTTTDILAGMFLVSDPDFKVGKRVIAGGVEGVVREVNIRKTRIIDDAGNLHVLPNRSVDTATYVIQRYEPPGPEAGGA